VAVSNLGETTFDLGEKNPEMRASFERILDDGMKKTIN
jgi:hypothetical protein